MLGMFEDSRTSVSGTLVLPADSKELAKTAEMKPISFFSGLWYEISLAYKRMIERTMA